VGAMKDLAISQVNEEMYGEGYFERGEGSNYVNYADDPRWVDILKEMEAKHNDRELLMLEVGAAKGWFIHHANLRGHRAEGIDISKYAVDNCAPLARGFLKRGDATEGLPFGKNRFDIVCSWEFFEHIDEEESREVLNSMIGCLKVGGELWLRIALTDGASTETDKDATHINVKPRAWWERIFTEEVRLLEEDTHLKLDKRFEDSDWAGRFFVLKRIA